MKGVQTTQRWHVRFDHTIQRWIAQGRDGELLRRVEAAAGRESWTQYDVELAERDWLPAELRRGLRSPVGHLPASTSESAN